VLGSALIGIEDALTPPAPITGNACEQELPQVPGTWDDAINAFEKSALASRIFDTKLVDNLIRTKRQEMVHFDKMTPEEQLDHYLDLV
jgi:glutamine synthetase